MDAHLGYPRHDPGGRDGGNFRNGRRGKTVAVAGSAHRGATGSDGSFEPVIVRKRQRRLCGGDGIDGIVLSLSAKGLTTGEIAAHLAEMYGTNVSKETISAITDRVLDAMADWQARPLDGVYPVPAPVRANLPSGGWSGRPRHQDWVSRTPNLTTEEPT